VPLLERLLAAVIPLGGIAQVEGAVTRGDGAGQKKSCHGDRNEKGELNELSMNGSGPLSIFGRVVGNGHGWSGGFDRPDASD
jgi:hypothetical protein